MVNDLEDFNTNNGSYQSFLCPPRNLRSEDFG